MNEIEILDTLKVKYPTFVNPDLIGLSILQDENTVYLKTTFKANPERNSLEALDFIVDDELIELDSTININFFNSGRSVLENAERFVNELDAYSMMMCADDIFTEVAEKEILKNLE